MNELLYEPLKYYESHGQREHKANVESFFSSLKERSGVDENKNAETVNKYKLKQAEVEKAEKKARSLKATRILLIIASVVGVILLICGISSSLLLSFAGVAMTASSLCVIFFSLNKRIKTFSELLSQKRREANELLCEAKQQMAPLNALFSERDAIDLLEKTLPELKFNVNFNLQKEAEYIERGGTLNESDLERSTLDVLSGEFNGNPFLYQRSLIHKMGSETYHGSLTISWTETYRDSKGAIRTRTRSQTLHASVEKPKPFYSEDTVLKYVCQGAPELSFTREGMYHDDKSDKQIERTIKKGEKKLKNKQEQAQKNGRDFVEMANTEFEVLFGALNRDHEVQFRMMFTPLAQNNMVDLMRSEVGYGDDFDFYKRKRENIIHSDHAQRFKMQLSPENYYSYDLKEIENKFIRENEEYFKSVFFDFAPLFAVPMYLDEPVKSLEPLKEYKCNYTSDEYEALANRMPLSLLSAEGSATRSIIKSGEAKKTGGATDKAEITAYSYLAYDRMEYVSKMGRDGRMHLVPVPWVEYIPVEKTSYIEIEPDNGGKADKGFSSRCHGLGAKIAN